MRFTWARSLTFTKNRPYRTITFERARYELTHDTGKDPNEPKMTPALKHRRAPPVRP
jgi:hypothetical protein